MRVLYLPDWNERPDDLLIRVMSKSGCEVHVVGFDYSSKNIIHCVVSELCKCPTIIVGNSLGAYFGFYASNVKKVPALLLNPSFFFKNGCELKSDFYADQFLDKKIYLSLRDECIDTKRVFKYLREMGYENQVKVFDNLTHAINIVEFEKFFSDFYERYKDFKHPNFDPERKKPAEKKSRYSSPSSIDWSDPAPVPADRYIAPPEIEIMTEEDQREEDQLNRMRERLREASGSLREIIENIDNDQPQNL